MKRTKRAFAPAWRTALVVLACAACAGRARAQQALTDHETAEVLPGASLRPPAGDGWKVSHEPTPDFLLLYTSRLPDEDHSLVLSVTVEFLNRGIEPPAAFLDFVRSHRLATPPGKGKMRTMEVAFDSTRSPVGADYHYVYEDGTVPGKKGELRLLEAHGWVGYHPDTPHVLYGIEFSERAPEHGNRVDPARADSFLAGLRFRRADPALARTTGIGDHVLGVATGFGSVWAGVTRVPAGETKARTFVTRLDAATMTVQSEIPVEPGGLDIVAGDDAMWLTLPRAGKIARIDPGDGRVEYVKCGGTPGTPAATPGTLWVPETRSGRLRALDTKTRAWRSPDVRDLKQPWGIVASEGLVWVSSADHRQVVAIDPATRQPAGEPIGVAGGCSGITCGAGSLWVWCSEVPGIQQLDPVKRSVLATIPLPGVWATAPVFADDRVWIGDQKLGGLWFIDARAQKASAAALPLALEIPCLVAGDHGLWFSDWLRGCTGFVRSDIR